MIGHLNTVDLRLSHRDPHFSSGAVFPSASDTFLEELLFQDLDSNHNEDVTSVIQSNKNIFVNSTRRNVFEQCSELSELYPSSSDRCGAILKKIPLHFIDSSHSENASAAVTVFGVLLKIFRSHCSSSLLEMIYNEIEMIECHMKIFICLIHLFQNKAHSYLVKEDGHVYNFFTGNGYKSVVERIILQLIDVVYSQVLPLPWESLRPIPAKILQEMSSLRDALSEIVPLVETVSRLIINKFELQQWRIPLNEGAGRTFISSINPEVLKAFWNGQEGKIF